MVLRRNPLADQEPEDELDPNAGPALDGDAPMLVLSDQEKDGSATTISASGDVVTVACKLPSGLFLQLHEMVEVSEPVIGGTTRLVMRARPRGNPVRINGFSMPRGVAIPRSTFGGFGLTYNVPRDFFEEWLHQNADNPAVEQRLIFAHERHDYAQSMAAERKDSKSGLEPLDPTKVRTIGKFKIEQENRNT